MHLEIQTHTDNEQTDRNPILCMSLANGEFLVVMADGSESGFDSRHQPIMDLSKGVLAASLNTSIGSIPERLRQAASALEIALFDQFPSSEEIGEGKYAATFIAIVLSGYQAFSIWIGSQQAKLFRGGICVKSTCPHVTVLSNQQRRIAIPSKFLHTEIGRPQYHPDIDGPWYLSAGDTLVIADYRLFMLGTDEDVSGIVSIAQGSTARLLVEWAEEIQHRFAQSAIVVKIKQ